jgi:heptosyltransferase-2
LYNNPLVDRVYIWEPENWLILEHQKFDLVLNVDKSQRSGSFAMRMNAPEKLGFGMHPNGSIVPLNKEAQGNYILGLDDHVKFKVNRRTVQRIQCEQFKLDYARDEYLLELTDEEKRFRDDYKRQVGIGDDDVAVGFNTGCSELYPNKKLTIDQHVELISRMAGRSNTKLVLVGGPEDTRRNEEIVRLVGEKVINTPTTEGVRRGLCYESICDVVITGDSFGMHAAIGLKKFVIAWFGVTCPQEIDLYDRGAKILPNALECSPCWKRQCPYNLECIQMVDLDAIVQHVDRFRKNVKQVPTS